MWLSLPPLVGISLKLLNVRYDVTPMKFISMVITEVGMLPPTARPRALIFHNPEFDDVDENHLYI